MSVNVKNMNINMNSIYLFFKRLFIRQNLNIYPAYKWEISNKLINYFFTDMINIKDFDPSPIKIDKKSIILDISQ